MSKTLALLEESISDVGFWRWWDADLPNLFAVEFGGVKLWTPPTNSDRPPPGIIGLGFKNPSLVAFLTDTSATELRHDWRLALHDDQIEPFGMFDDAFSLRSDTPISDLVKACSVEYLVGSEQTLLSSSPARLAFRAGPVGLIVMAEEMAVQPFSGQNWEIDIESARERWQQYWGEYWSRRDTDAPMPKDYACEVCIPRARFRFHEG